MVEVVTVQDGMTSVSSDLGHIVYTPDALASISSTAIEVDTSGKLMVLKYKEGGKGNILNAVSSSLNQSLAPPTSVLEDADAGAQSSDSGEDLNTEGQDSFDEAQMHQAASAATDVEDDQTRSTMDDAEESHDRSLATHQERNDGLMPQKRLPYTVTSTDFLTLPLGPPELRFRVS